MKSIGLDASSTTLGWALFEGSTPVRAGTYPLRGVHIAQRCLAAEDALERLLLQWYPTKCVRLESPVWSRPNALIPQARVSGVLLLVCARHSIPVEEVTPTHAKKKLTLSGTATKEAMVRAAAPYLGFDLSALRIYAKRTNYWVAESNGEVVYDEHAADALAVGLCALRNHS